MLVMPVVILTLLIIQVANAAFSDVTESTNYASSIDWMSDNGVIQGYPDGTFKPDQCVNRAEFLKMMYLNLGTNIIVQDGFAGSNYYDNFFSDTSTDQWYWPYVEQALREQAIEGYPDGTFKPGQCVNRAEAVKMAVLSFDIYNENADTEREAREETLYNDAMPGDHWFEPYLYSAVDRNAVGKDHVFTIDDGYYFDPRESMSRKEVAEMLYRMKTLTDNEVFGYVESMSPNPLNFYISPSNGVSFLMPDGWWVIHDDFYTTAGGAVADYPSILINGPTEAGEETVAINQRQMDCGTHEYAATCYDINENYKIGAYDPTVEASYLMDKILLTFREPADGIVVDPSHYYNQEFKLSFDIPEGWHLESDDVMETMSFNRLNVVLLHDSIDDLRIAVQTPILETGYESSIITDGFDRDIEGLTAYKTWHVSHDDRDNVWAYNSYYIYESDWSSTIEFFYAAPDENTLNDYLNDYYTVLDSVEFTKTAATAFDGCGVVGDYIEEEWFTDFVGKWDDYLPTLDGVSPVHDPLFDQESEGCLALDGSRFIFIPYYYIDGCKKVFIYYLDSDTLSIAGEPGLYCAEEFGPRVGDYVTVYGIDDYYGCQYTTGNYYYISNRVDPVEDSCTN